MSRLSDFSQQVVVFKVRVRWACMWNTRPGFRRWGV